MPTAELELVSAPNADTEYQEDLRKPTHKNGKLYINPFGVILGQNLSGLNRGPEVLTDAAFMNATRAFGIVQPVIVAKRDGVYHVLAGNRRTFALRHVIAKGEIAPDDPRALLPIYEANEIAIGDGVSQDSAINLIENAMRKRIGHIAKARAIDDLMSKGATWTQVALLVVGPTGRPLKPESIRQYRQLLKLHPSVQKAVDDGLMKVSRAQSLIRSSPDEQIRALADIEEASKAGGKSKQAAVSAVIHKLKKSKRQDRDEQPIFDMPRNAPDVRRAFKAFTVPETWNMLSKTRKPKPEHTALLIEMFLDIGTWLEGGLTPRKYQPEDLTLALKTRLVAAVASLNQ